VNEMSKRILRWFGNRRNETVLQMTHRHLELTTEAVKQLYEMVRAVRKSPSEKKNFYDIISQHEMQADQIRRDMVTELSNRDLYPDERDDLMELVRAVDWVADWAREAGRILVIIPYHKLPPEFQGAVEDMCRENYSCVRVLAKCIFALSNDPRKTLDLADQVELLEEDLDDLYSIARNYFVDLDDIEITRGAMILVNELIDAIETVSDWCENTADIARAIAIRVL
jgi:predicted phosphate transport protein (TIGR00153 family)